MEEELAIILRRDGDQAGKREAWIRVLAACAASGSGPTAFCRRHGIPLKRFFRWRAKLGPAHVASTPELVELSGTGDGGDRRIEIVLGAARVLLPAGSSLPEVLRALREAAC